MQASIRPPFPLIVAGLLLGPLSTLGSAQRDSDFMTAFRQLLEEGSREDMAALIKEHEEAAVLAVVETCNLISQGSSDQLEEEIDWLGKAWRTAYDSSFVMNVYEYVSLLSGVYKRTRSELFERWEFKREELAKAIETDDEGKFAAVGMDLMGMAQGFEEVGDHFLASECYRDYGRCFDEELVGDDADLRRACEGMGKSVAARDRIDLHDSLYALAKTRFDKLEYDGYGDPDKGPEARARERAAADSSFAPTPIGASFELVAEIEGLQRPIFAGDSVYQSWSTIILGEKGSTGTIPSLENSPSVLREGIVKVSIDTNGDGEGDVEVPLGLPTPVRFMLGDGDNAREWAMLVAIGRERDIFNGIQPFNLAPGDESMQIYIAPASSVVGTIAETRIQVFDDNVDGVYGSPPKQWAMAGLRTGDVQWDVDSMLVGEAKRVIPWSELVKVGEEWYRLEQSEAGNDIIATKAPELKTGTLKLDFKGLKPDWVIMRGKGIIENVYVEVAAAGKKGVEVPAGAYQLFSGRVSKGRRDQLSKALMVPSKNSPSWRVQADGTATVELGAPFGFDFSISQTDDSVTVNGESIVVTGRGQETYQRFWNCAPRPEASCREEGAKKGGKRERLRTTESQLQIDAQGNYEGVWFPYTVTLPKKKSGKPAEVQLIEKKNRLFGKVESDWKGE